MEFKRDVQNEGSIIDGVAIDRVGIKNVLRKVDIKRKNMLYSINAEISGFISLIASQRGIHMSRTAESIEEVINNATIKPAKTVEEFCIRIAKSLLKKHTYTDKAEVEMKGTLFISIKANERDQTQRAYEMFSKVVMSKDYSENIKTELYVGVCAEGITACPCAQEMSAEYAREILKKREELHLTEDVIEQIVNLVPIASHNQRAKGRIIIGSKNHHGSEEFVDILDLIDVIEDSMSGKINTVLKRPDEAELVRIAHLNPMFVEDVVRKIVKYLASSKFNSIDDECTIHADVDSQESIHHHNAYAEINTTFKEIRKLFQKN